MKTRQLLVGMVLGLAAGAALGVLFAPKKGSVTRRFIAKRGNAYAGDMKERFNESLKTVNQKIDSLRDEVKTLVKKGLVKAEEEFKKSSV